ncbi:YceD family protein [Aerococcus viridans]|uniref:YceD family protein n=1 Tax=Aerococcus viridans TaxID=1377 RepID=UPI0037F35843
MLIRWSIMKWSIQELRQIASQPMIIQESVDMKEQMKAVIPELIDISPVSVDGMVLYEEHTVLTQLRLALKMTMPSTRSLEPVVLDLQLPVSERFIEDGWETDIVDEEHVVQLSMDSYTLDLRESIRDNILLNLPIQILTEEEEADDAFPEGDDWRVVSQTEFEAEREEEEVINPEFAKLQDLFKDSESSDEA